MARGDAGFEVKRGDAIAGPVRFERTADVLLNTMDGVVEEGIANCGVPRTLFGSASTSVSIECGLR